MRASFKEINSKNVFIIPIVIILFVLASYITIWFKIKNTIVNYIDSFYSPRFSFTYDSISVSGFPFIIKTKIKNFNIGIKTSIGSSSIIFENLIVKNVIFTKKANISVDGKIYLYGKDSNKYVLVNNDNIDVFFDKKWSLESLDGFINNLVFVNVDRKIDLNNTTIKLITTQDYDYKNRTIRLNIDQIKYDNKGEANFEFIYSNILEKNNNQLVSIKNIVDVFSFNDITNNYNISAKLDNNISILTKQSPLNIELSINNYNSLIRSINNPNSVFLFKKDDISNFVQFMTIIPKNNKDTVNNKYYNLSMDLITKKTYINNMDAVNLIQKILFYK